jgi:glycosyltransferase involved in cell wall biosynthesis
MNLALVITDLRGGGAEKAMLRLAAALARHGHRVRLILLGQRSEHEIPRGVELHALAPAGGQLGGGWLGRWRAALRLRRLYRRLGLGADCTTISTLPFADQVVAGARLPNTWFRIANTLSAEVDALARNNPRKAARRLSRYRKLYEGRDLVAVSDGVAEDLRGALGLSRSRIVRIYNGFDFDAIRRAAMRADPDLPREPFVLHVGRFTPQKRHDLLFDAWRIAALPQRLVLMAPPSEELDALIAAKGLRDRVLIAGFRSDPYSWMRAAELLVLCSDREGMPNVLVEALACGTRVVSTDCPSGPREVLRGELARWLVPCGDAAALARAMRAALAAPRPRADAVPGDFSEANMVRAYEALAQAA